MALQRQWTCKIFAPDGLTLRKNVSPSNFTVTQSSVDPAIIGKAVVDHYNSVFSGNLLSYDTSGTTVSTVGTAVSYTFVDQTWLAALGTVGKLSGSGWFWKIDENGVYW